jgi:hypothetical protein
MSSDALTRPRWPISFETQMSLTPTRQLSKGHHQHSRYRRRNGLHIPLRQCITSSKRHWDFRLA